MVKTQFQFGCTPINYLKYYQSEKVLWRWSHVISRDLNIKRWSYEGWLNACGSCAISEDLSEVIQVE